MRYVRGLIYLRKKNPFPPPSISACADSVAAQHHTSFLLVSSAKLMLEIENHEVDLYISNFQQKQILQTHLSFLSNLLILHTSFLFSFLISHSLKKRCCYTFKPQRTECNVKTCYTKKHMARYFH